MSKKHFFVFLFFLFIFVSSPSNADKEPIWQWSSAVGVSDVTISEDSLNISASYGNKLRCKINVIPFNDIGNKFARPDGATINRFIETLYENQIHYQTLVRWSKGNDIDAACGQLSAKNND